MKRLYLIDTAVVATGDGGSAVLGRSAPISD